jgi:hypothetical protein
MAGTFHGCVDIVSNTPVASATMQEIFTNTFGFFQHLASSSYAQLIALNTGSLVTGGTVDGGGTNFHNQTRPFSENAWACFRMPSGSAPDGSVSARAVDYYVFFQWSYNNSFNANSGAPAAINGSTSGDGVGFQVAWRDDGLSPWNGTNFSMTQSSPGTGFGEDKKSSPVWTAGTSSLHVFPRSNNTGGNYNTNKENCASWIGSSLSTSTAYRYHFIGDRDSFFCIMDYSDNNSYDGFVFVGILDVIQGITTGTNGSAPMPMYMLADTNDGYINQGQDYGDTNGTLPTQGGIVGVQAKMTAPVRNTRNDRYSNNIMVINSGQEPNPQFTSASFDLFRIPLMLKESPDLGLVGFINNLYETFNANVNTVNSSSTNAIFGLAASSNKSQFVMPWSGSSPGNNTTRVPVYF